MTKTEKQKIGAWGENQASIFLSGLGYKIVDRNFTIVKNGKKAGEIDIVAWHKKVNFGRTLCFVEVKTRSYGVGSAERATNQKKKIATFLKTARQYCTEKEIDIERTPIQFEHVSVYIDQKNGKAVFKKYVIPIE